MKTLNVSSQPLRATARLAVVAASLLALGACASIPQRAWRNGEALSQSRAYNEMLSGNHSFEVARQLEQSMDPLRLGYREVAYPAFGRWW